MRHSKLLIAASIALLFNALSCAAADPAPAPAPAGHDMMKGHDMMAAHHGAGQTGKGHRCMHKGGMMGAGHMPHMMALPSLPPGNEKLELQMQAAIMQ